MGAILKKELKSYFTSLVGYLFIGFFMAILGYNFMIYNLHQGFVNFEYVLDGILFVFVLLVPILTMRLLAEEKHQKTDQLLYTSPLSINKIVIGKYLAVLLVFLSTMAIASFYPLIVNAYGEMSFKLAYSGILGFCLVGAAYLAIGLFISALLDSQVLSAVICFVVLLVTFLMKSIVRVLPTTNQFAWLVLAVIGLMIAGMAYYMLRNLSVAIIIGVVLEAASAIVYLVKPSLYDGIVAKIFGWFSVVDRYNNFINGVFDLSGIVYYLSIIFVFLFLTIQSLNKRRWR